MKCCNNKTNQYKLCYDDGLNSYDYCLIDYIPLVTPCDISIKIITQTNNDIIQAPEIHSWWEFLWNYIKSMFDKICLFRIDSTKVWKRHIVVYALKFIEFAYSYRTSVYIVVLSLALLLFVSFNIFIVGGISFLTLIVYLPIMQINKDLENYTVIDVNYRRKVVQSKKTQPQLVLPRLVDYYTKCHYIRLLLQGEYIAKCSNILNSYEKNYICQVVESLNLSKETIKSKTILVSKVVDNQYYIFKSE